jgi:hypothetical protein
MPEILQVNGSCTVRSVVYGTYMSESERLELRVSPDLLGAIDRARGGAPRATWVKLALYAALDHEPPAARVVKPSRFDQPVAKPPKLAQGSPKPRVDLQSASDLMWERQQKANKLREKKRKS